MHTCYFMVTGGFLERTRGYRDYAALLFLSVLALRSFIDPDDQSQVRSTWSYLDPDLVFRKGNQENPNQ